LRSETKIVKQILSLGRNLKFLVFMLSSSTTNKLQGTPVELYRLSPAGCRAARLKYGCIFSGHQLLG